MEISNSRTACSSGRCCLGLPLLTSWKNELDDMNPNKRGMPFEYLHSFVAFVTFARDIWRLIFRAAEGLFRVLGTVLGFEAPGYTTLWET